MNNFLKISSIALMVVCSLAVFNEFSYAQMQIINGVIHSDNESGNKWLYQPIEKPVPYSKEQLEQIIRYNSLSATNSYFVKSDYIFEIIGQNHNVSKVLFYDNEGKRRLVIPENTCEAPGFIEGLDKNLNHYPIAKNDSLKSILVKLEAFTNQSLDFNLPTAIIFWNRTLGIAGSDNLFDKEQALKEKFDGAINVLFVSTDAIASWPYETQVKYLSFLQKIVDNVPAANGF